MLTQQFTLLAGVAFALAFWSASVSAQGPGFQVDFDENWSRKRLSPDEVVEWIYAELSGQVNSNE